MIVPIDRSLLTEAIRVRFTEKMALPEPGKGCVNWLGNTDQKGYGLFSLARRSVRAHRLSYELFVGPIPAGLVLDHMCRNRSCVRPAHLRPVTNRENLFASGSLSAPALQVARDSCSLRGHPLTGNNLSPSSLAQGRRKCRACSNAYTSADNAKRRRGEIWSSEMIAAYADRLYRSYMNEADEEAA